MNAYELADKLKLFWHTENDNLFEDTATMLRQQADYIKHLEQGLESSIALNKAQAERQNK